MNKLFLALNFMVITFSIKAQQIQILTKDIKSNLIGLSVVDNNIVWASGAFGIVAKSTDGGKNFKSLQVAGYEKREFRDIEAFDSNTAIIMAIEDPAVILKTKDGGKNWYKVFENSTKGMFLDAMDFNGDYGVVIGDPINNHLFQATTDDQGEHWRIIKHEDTLANGEAFFAASGTNIKYLKSTDYPYVFATGGTKSRLFIETIFTQFL